MTQEFKIVSGCELCGGSELKLVDEGGHILQCRRCGLRFVRLQPKEDDLSQVYEQRRLNRPIQDTVTPQEQLIAERRFEFLNRFIQGGKILDVGAGLGEFLSLAQKTGKWRCFGTEISPYCIDFAKRKFNLVLSFGRFEDLGYPKEFFDTITFWHVLEHLPYPSQAIKEAGRILKDKGLLFIAVPNDSWLGRKQFFKNAFKKVFNRLPLKKKLKLKKMYPEIEESEKHLFYFTPRTLTKLLARYGFRIKSYSVDYDYGKTSSKIEGKYRFDLLFCRFTGINLSNAILITAQKDI